MTLTHRDIFKVKVSYFDGQFPRDFGAWPPSILITAGNFD